MMTALVRGTASKTQELEGDDLQGSWGNDNKGEAARNRDTDANNGTEDTYSDCHCNSCTQKASP